jgi:hypothetical protein
LGASIESAFDIKATLVEGHNGIYEISVGNDIVYSNMSQCNNDSSGDEQIIEQLGKVIGLKPKHGFLSSTDSGQEEAPACPLPENRTGEAANEPNTEINTVSLNSDCGCMPVDSATASDEYCIEPEVSNMEKTGCC